MKSLKLKLREFINVHKLSCFLVQRLFFCFFFTRLVFDFMTMDRRGGGYDNRRGLNYFVNQTKGGCLLRRIVVVHYFDMSKMDENYY